MAEKEFDLRKEFDILEEVVNDDHKERINSLEKQLKTATSNIDELRSILGYQIPDWIHEPMEEKGILPLLFYFDQGMLGAEKKERQDAFWRELNTILDAFGLVSKSHLLEHLENIDARLHRLTEDWAIDELRTEVGKWWKSEMAAIKEKLEIILKHIGDQPVNKTLREEVEAVGSE